MTEHEIRQNKESAAEKKLLSEVAIELGKHGENWACLPIAGDYAQTPWRLVPTDDKHGLGHAAGWESIPPAYEGGIDVPMIAATIGGYNYPGKVHIHGCWPQEAREFPDSRSRAVMHPARCFSDSHPARHCHSDINIGETRGAAVVAKEIVRRFLPGYLKAWAALIEQRAASQKYFDAQTDRTKAASEMLAYYFGGKVRTYQRKAEADLDLNGSKRITVSLDGYDGKIRIEGKGSCLEMFKSVLMAAKKLQTKEVAA